MIDLFPTTYIIYKLKIAAKCGGFDPYGRQIQINKATQTLPAVSDPLRHLAYHGLTMTPIKKKKNTNW